jgi:hypothetical protein
VLHRGARGLPFLEPRLELRLLHLPSHWDMGT